MEEYFSPSRDISAHSPGALAENNAKRCKQCGKQLTMIEKGSILNPLWI